MLRMMQMLRMLRMLRTLRVLRMLRMLHMLRRLRKSRDTAVLFISTNLAELGLSCSHLGRLDDGAVREAGPVAEMLESPVFAAYTTSESDILQKQYASLEGCEEIESDEWLP